MLFVITSTANKDNSIFTVFCQGTPHDNMKQRAASPAAVLYHILSSRALGVMAPTLQSYHGLLCKILTVCYL
jgi:hypothetical protein